MLNPLLRQIIRNMAKHGTRSSSSKAVDIKLATLNDLPTPCGSWHEHYAKRQKIYNAQLIAGVTVLLSTITFIKVSGIIFFNWGPPEEPVQKE